GGLAGDAAGPPLRGADGDPAARRDPDHDPARRHRRSQRGDGPRRRRRRPSATVIRSAGMPPRRIEERPGFAVTRRASGPGECEGGVAPFAQELGGPRLGPPWHQSLGDVTITSIVEIDRSSFPTPAMLPESTAEGVARHFSWLKPHFFDERTGDIGSRIQTFVVRTREHLVLIDTCVGNDKPRDEVPAW